MWIAAALILATSASAAEPKKKRDDSKAEAAAETPKQKMEKRKAAKEAGSAAEKKSKAEAQADAADKIAALRAKSNYMYAVEACDQPAHCDAAFRDDAEQAFMDACRACAPVERCEAERASIKEGSAKRNVNPCGR